MNAACQLQKVMMKATIGGATAAPTTRPRFCSDMAWEYSRRGNQRLSRIDAAGQVIASARPKGMRNAIQAPNEVAVVVRASRMHHTHSAYR